MKTKRVKDLMIPLSQYVTVSQDATLCEAVAALRESKEKWKGNRYRHRAVLVYDHKNKIIGKVGMIDVLRDLEPKYETMLSNKKSFHLGFSAGFQKAMLEELKLWNAPLKDICKKAAQEKVTNFMTTVDEGECIDVNDALDTAIHLLVMGRHQSLMVVEKNEIIGILRLTDVFEEVGEAILSCSMEAQCGVQ